ncbi:hypothetical protein [Microbacterium sp. JB110]|uniref:hypothetical protein n=1 Tax=unclassified Microbacterium TaxID=2609290 RepID=UPI00097F5184|nr:hypothetical protein [Microbacterium sp. JB110]SJM63104.1 Cell division protein FtsL [Frigoribacterium sp. JB110]
MSLAESDLLLQPTPRRRQDDAPGETPEPRRRLRALERPEGRRRPRTVYAVVAMFGVILIAGAQIVLSMLTTQDSYAVAELMQERRDLTLQQQGLEDAVAGLSSPQYLAANAADLGMVIDGAPKFLRLSDGKVTGTGASSTWNSSVDVSPSQVGNALIADTPLATDPNRSVAGSIETEKSEDAGGESGSGGAQAEPEGPPSIDKGLPSPETH